MAASFTVEEEICGLQPGSDRPAALTGQVDANRCEQLLALRSRVMLSCFPWQRLADQIKPRLSSLGAKTAGVARRQKSGLRHHPESLKRSKKLEEGFAAGSALQMEDASCGRKPFEFHTGGAPLDAST